MGICTHFLAITAHSRHRPPTLRAANAVAAEMAWAGGSGAATGARGRAEGDWAIAVEELEWGKSLGRGGQGEVFRSRCRQRDVAIKRLDADLTRVAAGSVGAALERGIEELRRMAAACEGSKRVCR